MSNLEKTALPAVESLLDAAPDELFAELELRRRLIVEQPRTAGSFEAATEYRSVVDLPVAQLAEFGRRFFARFSRDMHELVCGADPSNAQVRTDLRSALTSKPTFAAALACVLVSHFGTAPALAAVLAALVVRLFFDNALHVLCEMWSESLSKAPV
jgi:hypothetical protein